MKAGLSVVVVLAAHPYRDEGEMLLGRESAFLEDIRGLEVGGAEVRVVRKPGGVGAAFAEGAVTGAATRGAL